ncbi:hypothetical protein ACIQCD_26245 [Streptomyces sp. NPDC093250]|uniref:hypothetical protein n=1 Tax=Streptomyces sp. NPDC093250 TaxID=3366036 RepID=UPI00382F2F5A
MGMKSKVVLGAVAGIAVIAAVSANSGDAEGGSTGKGSSASAQQQAGGSKADGTSDTKSEDKDVEKASQTEQFKAFVQKNGTAKEKEAVSHVTKVQGADEQNNILDAADVYTDFTGGILGEGTGPAKLIASAFADWKQSDNGLVTVYDADGELLGNGKF